MLYYIINNANDKWYNIIQNIMHSNICLYRTEIDI